MLHTATVAVAFNSMCIRVLSSNTRKHFSPPDMYLAGAVQVLLPGADGAVRGTAVL